MEISNPNQRVELLNNHTIDKDAERLARMTTVLGKFSTALALKPVTVDVTANPPKPGIVSWSTNNTIQFDSKAIGDLTEPENVAGVKGLGLHETAHIMLTPPIADTKLGKAINAKDMWRAFNTLEDQRIETQLTTLFSNTEDWLTASTIKQLQAAGMDKVAYQYPLIAGRKYLDPELRGAFRDAFVDPTVVDRIDELIDEYVSMPIGNPKTHPRLAEIIDEFNQIMELLPEPPNGGDGGDGESSPDSNEYDWTGCGWENVPESSYHQPQSTKNQGNGPAPLTPQQQQDIADKVKDKIKSGGYPAPTKPKGNGNQPDGNTPAPVPNEPGDDTATGKEAGVGGELHEMLDKHLKDILTNKQADIRKTIAQFNGEVSLDGKSVPPPKRNSWVRNNPVDPKTVKASKSFARELELIRADYDPGWLLRTEQGRINVQRYATGCDVDEAFDEWDTGREDVIDIECVIVIDNSGSMSDVMSNAYQSMWAIKRALDKVDASTTVVAFGSEAVLVYSADERASATYRDIGLGGGTQPLDAINYARSVLANSNRAIKLFIAITDGAWGQEDECNDIIRKLRNAGVLTALGMIGASSRYDAQGNLYQTIDTHGCEVAVSIDDMGQLFVLAKDMVRAGVRKNLIR